MNKPAPSIFRIRDWRGTLVAALIGLLIVMAIVMKWLVEFQVSAAQERRSLEALARRAEAQCFGLATHRATQACLAQRAAQANFAK